MSKTGVLIARFQTPGLNPVHHDLINYLKERHVKVVAVLGVCPVKGSTVNPLDFNTRERMLKVAFPDIVVLPLSDSRSDKTWSTNLDSLLSGTFQDEKFVIYGSASGFMPYYSGQNEAKEIPETSNVKGADLLEQVSEKVMDNEAFRNGIIYAYYNTYPKVYATLDIALFKDNYKTLLLGFRKAEGKWRLPGGFSDPSDMDYESAALRELHEECGEIEVGDMKYEKSFKVNDWRYRNEKDKIITMLFSCQHLSGEPDGSDDIDEVKWFALDEIVKMIVQEELVEEHTQLLNHLTGKYNK